MSNKTLVIDDSLKQYVNLDHTKKYVTEIFKNVTEFDMAWMVELRRLGTFNFEDGTQAPASQSIPVQILQFDKDKWLNDLGDWVALKCRDFAPAGVGCYMAPALINDREATDKSVQLMLTVCADFDTGNPRENLEKAVAAVGVRPTFVCKSGGVTEEGEDKLHAHWVLDEPCAEPWKVAYIREILAKRFGADESFKRIPQIIRIPGALYDKDGKWSMTEIIEYNDNDISLMDFEDALNLDFNDIEEGSFFHPERKVKTAEQREERMHQLHNEEVEAGRSEDTRFDRFSEYAGHQIRQCRFGHQTEEEALSSVKMWVADKMNPPWDQHRITTEFNALLAKDKFDNPDQWRERDAPPIRLVDQLVQTQPNVQQQAQPPAGQQADPPQHNIDITGPPTKEQLKAEEEYERETLKHRYGVPAGKEWGQVFGAHDLFGGKAPIERHLVENFLVHGSSVGLVADGGVGKTYMALEMALRCAAGPDFPNNNVFGFPVKEKMFVFVLTVEDGKDDIHRRLEAIDPSGDLRKAANDTTCIFPVKDNLMQGLTLVEKDSKGNHKPSVVWEKLVNNLLKPTIEKFPDYAPVVIVDTYSATHHGDENSSIGTNEWFRAANMLSHYGATLIVTHHTRKTDPKYEIKTPSDMKASVRGSTAFINSLRCCYGVWHMPNSDAVTKELKGRVEPGAQLFNMGILKSNTGIDWSDRSDPRYPEPMITLRRTGLGRLIYDAFAQQARIDLSSNKSERKEASLRRYRAAVLHVVRFYASKQWPLSVAHVSKKRSGSESCMTNFIDPKVNSISNNDASAVVTELINSGDLKQIKIKGRGVGQILDTPDGPYANAQFMERVDERPAFQWAHYVYDEEHESYELRPDLQHAMDV